MMAPCARESCATASAVHTPRRFTKAARGVAVPPEAVAGGGALLSSKRWQPRVSGSSTTSASRRFGMLVRPRAACRMVTAARDHAALALAGSASVSVPVPVLSAADALGSRGVVSGGTGAMRRWAEAHVRRGAGSPASTGEPWSMHRSLTAGRLPSAQRARARGGSACNACSWAARAADKGVLSGRRPARALAWAAAAARRAASEEPVRRASHASASSAASRALTGRAAAGVAVTMAASALSGASSSKARGVPHPPGMPSGTWSGVPPSLRATVPMGPRWPLEERSTSTLSSWLAASGVRRSNRLPPDASAATAPPRNVSRSGAGSGSGGVAGAPPLAAGVGAADAKTALRSRSARARAGGSARTSTWGGVGVGSRWCSAHAWHRS